MAERVWTSRLRWRLRGAWQWPAFVLGLVADAVLLQVLPVAGDGPEVVGAVLLAGSLQLIVIAALARPAGLVLRRLRPTLPRAVADDRAGALLLLALTGLLLGLGVAHRAGLRGEREAFATQLRAARAYVLANAPAEFRAGFDRIDTWRAGPGQYRSCAPGRDERRAYCVYVFTDSTPPRVVADPDRTPNSRLVGPASLGRRAP